ncbi:formylglycine-generating enzyme family protein [Marinilactibacillus sp. GCM10026970]|uniref:formylglycine-generating enzyme family protein n=1 Tax=Marinilactibacillus sp. GCM10026970 TaxID=3252642 RepID=UPI003614AC2A
MSCCQPNGSSKEKIKAIEIISESQKHNLESTLGTSCCSPHVGREKEDNLSKDSFSERNFYKTDDSSIQKMVLIDKGQFLMGSEDKDINIGDHEDPVRMVEVEAFYVDPTPVTNQEFQRFIEETGYVTEAKQYGWSFVFHLLFNGKNSQVKGTPAQTPWWLAVEGADWAHPEGPDSSIQDRLDHPVVHVSWNDANAYCEWAGKRLLTEKEWEYAARGGLVQKKYPWGNELMPDGQHMCNIWQGQFPYTNSEEDGFLGTSPVKAFPPNDYGIYSVSGNVWEWGAEYFDPSIKDQKDAPRVTRGGSYLCHDSYCNRYRVSARTSNTPDSSSGNTGFRCGKSVIA